MARQRKVGTLTKSGGARTVYEALQTMNDLQGHRIVAGELFTQKNPTAEDRERFAPTDIRGPWPTCRRICRRFTDAEVRR